MLRAPVVADVVRGLAILRRWVASEVERLQIPLRVGTYTGLITKLIEDRVSATVHRLLEHTSLRESLHTGKSPEVVVEGSILLHEDDHVFDIG